MYMLLRNHIKLINKPMKEIEKYFWVAQSNFLTYTHICILMPLSLVSSLITMLSKKRYDNSIF